MRTGLIAAGIGVLLAATSVLSSRGDPPAAHEASLVGGSNSRGFSIRARPSSRTVERGAAATYRVRIRHLGSTKPARTALRIRRALPSFTSADFRRLKHRSVFRLTVHTSLWTPTGSYRLRIRARNGRLHARAALGLTVTPQPGDGFEISGRLSRPLAPGVSIPVNLGLANPTGSLFTVSSLSTRVSNVTAPGQDAAHPCTAEDFSVQQFSGPYGFQLPESSNNTLASLGIPESQWPRVAMVDRPVNQDGCKGASLTLDFAGSAMGQ
jgi:hypothetical protein